MKKQQESGFEKLVRISSVTMITAFVASGVMPIKTSAETNPDSINLGITTSIANLPKSIYDSSSGEIDAAKLESMPIGNGDFSSALRMLPNVQTNNASMTSNSPGEVSPANISISGGLPYQNSFLIDGFDMNNDLDPAGSSANTQPRQRGGLSQGLNIDASLLQSINIQDANVPAAYGRFSGGVVEAKLRRPRRSVGDPTLFGEDGLFGWHGALSYQMTSSGLTKYHIYPGQEEAFKSSTSENFQPEFTKQKINAHLEGYATPELGIIASFSTIRSNIPLQTYANAAPNSAQAAQKTDQKRMSDNYFAKLYYDPSENLAIEAYFLYAPSHNTYFTPNFANSRYTMKSGGYQTGASAKYQNALGLLSAKLSYSSLENSRDSDVNYYTMINGADGQFGDVRQIQNSAALKVDMLFNSIALSDFEQNFSVGMDVSRQEAIRDRSEDSHMYIYGGNPVAIPAGQTWNGRPDSFGFVSANSTQFYDTMGVIKAHKSSFSVNSYALYVEDDAKLDLAKNGALHARLGLRLDGDDYLDKQKIAPRFSLSYIAPWEAQSKFTFGTNRYYARNLLAYRFYADAVNNRQAYYRAGPNDAWIACGSAPVTIGTNTYCGTPQHNNGVVAGDSTKLNDLDVPFDDELMLGYSQQIGDFGLNLRYIHRDGKKQVAQRTIVTPSGVRYEWGNDGWSKSNIITLSIQNAQPIETAGILHNYLLALDFIDTKRSHDPYSADIDNETAVTYNGVATTYANMPAQKVNQPLTLRFNAGHSFRAGKVNLSLNNFLRLKGAYERIVLTNYNPNGAQTQDYVLKKIKPSFGWDMRLGAEWKAWRNNAVFVNVDIYNVLNLKNEVALSAADGMNLFNVQAQMAVVGYELGRQIWAQVGYRF